MHVVLSIVRLYRTCTTLGHTFSNVLSISEFMQYLYYGHISMLYRYMAYIYVYTTYMAYIYVV